MRANLTRIAGLPHLPADRRYAIDPKWMGAKPHLSVRCKRQRTSQIGVMREADLEMQWCLWRDVETPAARKCN